MPRYGINVQYGPDKWERAASGIGQAISQYQAKQDADRAETNQIAAQGGVATGEAPATIGSRLGQIGNFIKRKVLHQGEPGEPAAVAQQGDRTPVTTQVPAAQNFAIPDAALGMGGATPAPAPAYAPPRRIGEALLNDPAQIAAQNRSAAFFGGTPATAASPGSSGAPVVRSGPGQPAPAPAPRVAPTSGSIGDALQPYTYTAGSGQKYTMDPNRQANAARALKRGEMQDELDVKGAEKDKDQAAQVQALVDAGMSPAVARAKVLNNVVKYDEQFGQQHPGAMNQKDRLAVQDRIDKRQAASQGFAMRLETLRQQGRSSTREFQELSTKLRQQAQDDANDRALLQADEAEAGRAGRAVTTLETNPVVSATPEGQTAIKDAKAAADAAAKRAAESRGRVAGKGGRAPVGTKPTINQAQYEAARGKINPATKQPYTDAEIEKFYTVDPSVKRK